MSRTGKTPDVTHDLRGKGGLIKRSKSASRKDGRRRDAESKFCSDRNALLWFVLTETILKSDRSQQRREDIRRDGAEADTERWICTGSEGKIMKGAKLTIINVIKCRC